MTVIITRSYTFTCNVCDTASDVITAGTLQGAWSVIARDGWVRDGVDRHLCPIHRHAQAVLSIVDDR